MLENKNISLDKRLRIISYSSNNSNGKSIPSDSINNLGYIIGISYIAYSSNKAYSKFYA